MGDGTVAAESHEQRFEVWKEDLTEGGVMETALAWAYLRDRIRIPACKNSLQAVQDLNEFFERFHQTF